MFSSKASEFIPSTQCVLYLLSTIILNGRTSPVIGQPECNNYEVLLRSHKSIG